MPYRINITADLQDEDGEPVAKIDRWYDLNEVSGVPATFDNAKSALVTLTEGIKAGLSDSADDI